MQGRCNAGEAGYNPGKMQSTPNKKGDMKQ